jgi:hypothetical protein
LLQSDGVGGHRTPHIQVDGVYNTFGNTGGNAKNAST